MYKIKRFSALTKIDKPNKSDYAVASGAFGSVLGFTGHQLGGIAGADYGANRYNKWAKNITEKQIPELVKRANEGSEFAADTLRQLNHPRTRESFKNIARNTVRRSAKIGARIGAGLGLATGVSIGVSAYESHKKKYNESNNIK